MCLGQQFRRARAVILSRFKFGDNFNINTENASISDTLPATFMATNITTFFVSWPNLFTNLPVACLNNYFLSLCCKRRESRPYLTNNNNNYYYYYYYYYYLTAIGL